MIFTPYKKGWQALLASCFLFGTMSCVNQIADEIEIGTIPITFAADVQKASTKMADNAFESGDETGLFATLSTHSIDQQRYINNLRLVCDGTEKLIPEREIFYPEGENALDMLSYYPYRKEGMEEGQSQIDVCTHADQSTRNGFSTSDFLVAEALQVISSPEPVELKFKHKFTKISLTLTPAEDESVEDLLNANPKIIASGFCSEAKYDFLTGTFSDLARPVDITPHGEWKKSDGTLTGKEFIVIPQGNPDGKQAFTMEWNGKIYICPMPSMEMESDVVCEINISAFQSTSHTLSGAVSSIKEWGEIRKGESDTQASLTSVKTAALSFEPSKVYRIYRNSISVAEVCKEFLYSEEHGLHTPAIVAYPVNNEQTDLSKGMVLHLLDTNEPVHGGSIQWGPDGLSFGYTPGTQQPVSEFYIDADNRICLTEPSNPASINISSYTLRDIRKGELETYPIVKIGTQYWMGEDLRARQYREGTQALTQTTQLGQAGYLVNKSCYFYTGEALLAGEMAPYGWAIPTRQDWEQMAAYVGQDASRIKGGTWKGFGEESTASPATNETGLNILPNGLYIFNDERKTAHYNWTKSAAYWIGGDTSCTLTEEAILLMGNNNEIGTGGNHPKGEECYAGLAIRCIKR